MKKTSAVILSLCLLMPICAGAETSQYELQTKAEYAFSNLEETTRPLGSAPSAASDRYIMALSRMNKEYRYASYADSISSQTPSSVLDAQRHIMVNAACDEKLSDSFVAMFTYDAELGTASERAGAVITLKSGGYDTADGADLAADIAGELITGQQQNGSFDNDTLSTAKSVIALSFYKGTGFSIEGENEGEIYTYDVDTAIDSAKAYLSSVRGSDGGYGSVINTAFVVMALDSAGTDAQSDPSFAFGGADPVTYIVSQIGDDGSIGGSPDDTAIAACAIVSHLRAVQGKSPFFDFTAQDAVDTIISGSDAGSNRLTDPETTAAPESPKATQNVIRLTQPPTREPEHSATDEEEYGPLQFVGPLRSTEEPAEEAAYTDDGDNGNGMGEAVLIAVLSVAAAVFAAILALKKLKPSLFASAANKLGQLGKKDGDAAEKNAEKDVLSEIDSSVPAVPTDELYDPDFIKKLIPVDELEDSVDTLIPDDEILGGSSESEK